MPGSDVAPIAEAREDGAAGPVVAAAPPKLTHLHQKVNADDPDSFKAAANSYNNIVADLEDQRCVVCGGPGHISDSCPVLDALKTLCA